MFLIRFLGVIFLAFFISQNTYAQSTDVIAKMLDNADEQLSIGKYNQASALLKEVLAQATKTKSKKHEAAAYDLLAEISIKKRDFKDFKTYEAMKDILQFAAEHPIVFIMCLHDLLGNSKL